MNGGPDPGCRGAFPWEEQQSWKCDLLDFYRQAIALRHSHPALCTGAVQDIGRSRRHFRIQPLA